MDTYLDEIYSRALDGNGRTLTLAGNPSHLGGQRMTASSPKLSFETLSQAPFSFKPMGESRTRCKAADTPIAILIRILDTQCRAKGWVDYVCSCISGARSPNLKNLQVIVHVKNIVNLIR